MPAIQRMMNKKEILKKIGGILTELNEQYEYLSQSSDNLNELELELFSANANFLSDHLSILVKLNDSLRKDEKAQRPMVLEEENSSVIETAPGSVTHEEKRIPDWKFELEKEPGLTFEFEEKQPDKLFDRPLTDEEKKVIDEKTMLKSDREDEILMPEDETNDKPSGNAIDAEAGNEEEANEGLDVAEIKISDMADEGVYVKEVFIAERTIAVPTQPKPEEHAAPTVNELLSRSMSGQTLSSQLNTGQVKDLKGMISLNDKFLFVRDLFNGYSLAYSEALELLNRFDNFEAADNFLKQNYALKNNWADKQDVTDKFYEILNRRFSK